MLLPPSSAPLAGWDGACLPIGLGLSLILNGIFFAKPLNEMQLLTLPDLFARKFGPATEVLFSFLAILSFCCLLGGNLVGAGRIIAFLFGFDPVPGIWITTFAIWLYTVSGGLISVAYTDVAQAIIGWTGLFVGSLWVLNNMPTSAGASPAFPNGDTNMLGAQMTDPDALGPELGTGIPNAIVFNWITIFVLGFGNLAALDFQARVPFPLLLPSHACSLPTPPFPAPLSPSALHFHPSLPTYFQPLPSHASLHTWRPRLPGARLLGAFLQDRRHWLHRRRPYQLDHRRNLLIHLGCRACALRSVVAIR